jgi:hypothetical protein
MIHLDIDIRHVLGRVMRFLVHGQQHGNIRVDVRPEFLIAAFDLLNSMHLDPRIRSLYEDVETLAGDVFRLFLYGALSTDHREAGFPKTGGDPTAEDLTQ